MFGEKEKKETLRSTEDNEQSILSLDNETGVDLRLVDLPCLQLINGTSLDKGREWKLGQSIGLTVSNERLSATHFPLIAEEIGKRKQEFTVEVRSLGVEDKGKVPSDGFRSKVKRRRWISIKRGDESIVCLPR